MFYIKQKNIDFSMSLTFGAGDRNRTCTPKALDPKSSASANSATSAFKLTLLLYIKRLNFSTFKFYISLIDKIESVLYNKIKVINLKSMLPIMTVNPRRQLWKKKLPPLKRTPTAVTVKKALYARRPKTALWSMTGRAAWNTAKGTASGGLMKQTTLKLHARF